MVQRRATPAGTDPPRSPASSAWTRRGRPSRRNQNWYSHSLDLVQTPVGTHNRHRIAWISFSAIQEIGKEINRLLSIIIDYYRVIVIQIVFQSLIVYLTPLQRYCRIAERICPRPPNTSWCYCDYDSPSFHRWDCPRSRPAGTSWCTSGWARPCRSGDPLARIPIARTWWGWSRRADSSPIRWPHRRWSSSLSRVHSEWIC